MGFVAARPDVAAHPPSKAPLTTTPIQGLYCNPVNSSPPCAPAIAHWRFWVAPCMGFAGGGLNGQALS